jgi:hypothetical protein
MNDLSQLVKDLDLKVYVKFTSTELSIKKGMENEVIAMAVHCAIHGPVGVKVNAKWPNPISRSAKISDCFNEGITSNNWTKLVFTLHSELKKIDAKGTRALKGLDYYPTADEYKKAQDARKLFALKNKGKTAQEIEKEQKRKLEDEKLQKQIDEQKERDRLEKEERIRQEQLEKDTLKEKARLEKIKENEINKKKSLWFSQLQKYFCDAVAKISKEEKERFFNNIKEKNATQLSKDLLNTVAGVIKETEPDVVKILYSLDPDKVDYFDNTKNVERSDLFNIIKIFDRSLDIIANASELADENFYSEALKLKSFD